ncbi:EAL domain-containing protein [Shewanella sp. D64]|uniref:EAL domain-containing protein n=1 Tax=unclassified Shewanella TaxID=196818 RepID=UPI0022BA5696|nr:MULTISPECIES: EAL domain-containing protein [unclassified Shewanella]MEC4727505.1 EAL domain-containing protein [Shewanella sp. D64]MEC4738086.1 EAL domain-containing protein [Shewanella sp. E94]WBJ96399.1 EAL domain-containing protein [Shewanella sp. MTB7]
MLTKLSSRLTNYYKAPWFITLLIFIIPLLLVALIHPQVAKYELVSKLQQDFDLLENLMVERMLTSSSPKEKAVIDKLSWTCSEDDIALLKSPEFSPNIVRLIQLELANGKKCSNLSVPYHYEADDTKVLPNTNIKISTSIDKNPFFRNFIFEIPAKEHKLVGVTNNTVFNSFLTELCPNCYQVDIQYHGLPLVSRGNQTLSNTKNSKRITRYIPSLDLTQTLISSDAMYQDFKEKSWLTLLCLSLIFSSLFTIYFWHWQHNQVSLETMLMNSLKKNEFIPYYQIIINTRSNEIVGQEMLVRWQRSDGELGAPNQFIPYAEDSGLVIPITESTLAQVKQDMPKLLGWVSVNIVAEHLENGQLSQWFEEHANHDTQRLCFELTERKPIANFEKAIIEINQLASQCHGFKLDDFGTGFGGFSYLQRLGVNSIKIDKMFIDTIGTDDFKADVLNSIIAFGHESKMEMIAEGIETQAQADYLNKRGVYLHQGYLYAQPTPLDKLQDIYARYAKHEN